MDRIDAVDKNDTLGQAEAVAALLLGLARQLFRLDGNPAAELPLAQVRVCGLLYDGPQSMSALARELGVSLSAMTQIADRLERARLVKREAHGSDRRVRWLQLTPRGEKMMRVGEDARVQRVSAVLEQLSAKERRQVLGTLESLMSACATSIEQNGARELLGQRSA